jgi:ABC-type branched-subunit amino acid transport system substrate-binding protein
MLEKRRRAAAHWTRWGNSTMTRWTRAAAVAVGGLGLFTVVAAPAAPDAPTPKPPIVVGMSAAFTGPSRGLGIELYRGSAAYFAEVNAHGGVHDRKIRVQAYDDGYNPDPAVDNTLRLIEKDDVFALFDYVGTPTTTRVLPLLKRFEDRHILLFCPFTGAEPHRQPPYQPFVFNLRASYADETAGLVDHFVEIGRKKIAVFYQIDAYGRSGWDGVRRALGRHHLRIAAEATYRRGAKFDESMARQVAILREGAPEAVVCVGAYAACAAFVRDARDAGWTVPIANVSFVGSENLLAQLQKAGETSGKDYTVDLINSQVVPSYYRQDLDAVKEYCDLMDKYDPKPPPGLAPDDYQPLGRSFVSFEGFLNAKLLVEVLQQAGRDPKREHLQAAAESVKAFDLGIDAKASFATDRHQALDQDNVFYTVVEDGRFVRVTDWRRWAP